jgi:hypothetical protein
MPRPTERYLHDLADALRWRPVLARRVVLEVADHLAQATATHQGAGLAAEPAEQAAIRHFGPAGELARQYRGGWLSLGLLLAAGAGATALIALWLLFVTTFVLPARDPADATMWRIIAGLFAGYSVVSVLVLAAPGRRLRRLFTAALSVAAVLFGAYAAVATLHAAASGRSAEGYLLLMGVMIAAHGMVALTFALLSARVPVTKPAGS